MRYKYRAVDAQGQEITGILTTQSEREATRQLQRRGLTVLNLSSLDQTQNATPQKAQKPKRRDLLAVLHELATLLSAGVSLIEAVESLAASSHPLFITQAFNSIAGKLRQGISFSLALKESGLPLPWYLFQLVEAGELTGKVDQALRDGVAQFEYETRVNDEMRSAMIYPTILIVSGIGAVLMIFIIVVPRFAGILNNRGADVPFLARAVLNSGMFLNHHWQLLLIGAGVLAVFLTYLFTQPKMRTKLSDFSLRVPLLGTWIMEAETARWASMLSTLLENRVSLLRALELAGQAIKLPSLSVRLSQVTKAVRAGTSLSQALQDNDALNPTGHNLIRAGERAGELARMLRSLAKLLEESGRTRMKRFLLLIEPLAILLIGGVIGVIITGVILAITSVNEIKF